MLIQDESGQVEMLLKYKGILIGEGSPEEARQRLLTGLRTGCPTLLDCRLQSPSALLGPSYSPALFSRIKEREYYKKSLLAEGEDVDVFGNEGKFSHDD